MKQLVALLFVVAACGGGSNKKTSSAIVPEGSAVSENCCCKSTPATSEDGKPVYQLAGRMECSSKQGECVDDVQCKPQPPVQ